MKRRKTMHRILSVLFSAVLIFHSLSICAFAENNNIHSVADEVSLDYSILNTETDNVYNKIHFYFDDYENATIDDMNELVEATTKLTESNSGLATVQRTYNSETAEVKLIQNAHFHLLLPQHKKPMTTLKTTKISI